MRKPLDGARTNRDPLRNYPADVRTPAQRHRWNMARRAARAVVQQIGGDEITVLLATRSLYRSDIPTDVRDEKTTLDR